MCAKMVYTTMIPRNLAQSTLTTPPIDPKTPTECWLNVNLNLNLVPKRPVSKALFHVKNKKISPLQEPALFELLVKMNLSGAKFETTSLVDFRLYMNTFANFEIYGHKLLA